VPQRHFPLHLLGFTVTVIGLVCWNTTAIALSQDDSDNPGPIVVSGEVLAQAVLDDVNAAAKKYHLTELQIDGVVAKQTESKGKLVLVQFEVKAIDPKSNKPVSFTIFCSLKDQLPKGDERIDALAVGNKITVRGKSGAMGNGQVTLYKCVIVPKKEEGAAKDERP
jgi:hypothetical protein